MMKSGTHWWSKQPKVKTPKARTKQHPAVVGIISQEKQKTHVLEVYRRVLSRNPSWIVTQENIRRLGMLGEDVRLKIVAQDNHFSLVCSMSRNNIVVICTASEVAQASFQDFETIKPFYEFRCDKDKMPKLRKQALILAKKISLFDVYQVMST